MNTGPSRCPPFSADEHGGYAGYLWTQGAPSTAKTSRGLSDDVCRLLHRVPALHSGRTVVADHTIHIHHRAVGVEFGEPCLGCGYESLLWRLGRMRNQARRSCLAFIWLLILFRSAVDSSISQGLCYGPQLGYSIPASYLSEVGLSEELANVAETGLLALLSLHLVAAGLSTTNYFLSLFLHSHVVAIIALIIAIVTAIVGSVVFAADLALVIVVKDNVDSLFSGASFSVQFGNGVWMILVAMVLTWVAVVLLSARACYCCGVRR